jgi:hypothetical protein
VVVEAGELNSNLGANNHVATGIGAYATHRTEIEVHGAARAYRRGDCETSGNITPSGVIRSKTLEPPERGEKARRSA